MQHSNKALGSGWDAVRCDDLAMNSLQLTFAALVKYFFFTPKYPRLESFGEGAIALNRVLPLTRTLASIHSR